MDKNLRGYLSKKDIHQKISDVSQEILPTQEEIPPKSHTLNKPQKKDKVKALIKNAPVYLIIWRDAFSESDEWHDSSSIEKEDYVCHTLGYLITDNSKLNYYTIASTVTVDDHFCMVLNIPKAMVISKQRINI